MTNPSEDLETTYNIFIGKSKKGEYWFLERSYKHGKNWRGLGFNVFEFYTEDEAEQRLDDYIDNDGLLDLWKEAVQNESTTESYDDWCDTVKEEDGLICVFDTSYQGREWLREGCEFASKKEDKEFDEYSTNCIGSWHDREMVKRSYWEYVNPENFKKLKELYEEYELPNDRARDVRDAKERLKELVSAGVFDEIQIDELTRKVLIPEYALEFLKKNGKKIENYRKDTLLKKMEEWWQQQKEYEGKEDETCKSLE